ncbi:hypothetical protein [Microcoleus sp. D3_18a_C4]|uniref:hypothetical protein n=1 Tax=unclassified Microcoleus TaxID=2642155 RepID=UPI002FD047C3
MTCRSQVIAKIVRSTGKSAIYRQHEAETGFFTQISGEASLTVQKPGFLGLCAIGTLPLKSYSLKREGRYCTKNWLSPQRVRQTAKASLKVHCQSLITQD